MNQEGEINSIPPTEIINKPKNPKKLQRVIRTAGAIAVAVGGVGVGIAPTVSADAPKPKVESLADTPTPTPTIDVRAIVTAEAVKRKIEKEYSDQFVTATAVVAKKTATAKAATATAIQRETATSYTPTPTSNRPLNPSGGERGDTGDIVAIATISVSSLALTFGLYHLGLRVTRLVGGLGASALRFTGNFVRGVFRRNRHTMGTNFDDINEEDLPLDERLKRARRSYTERTFNPKD